MSRDSDEQRVKEDLGAVGAVGVPSAVGISNDGEAVVDLAVVAFAEEGGVLQAGLPAVAPVQDVVDLAPPGGGLAAGEHAVWSRSSTARRRCGWATRWSRPRSSGTESGPITIRPTLASQAIQRARAAEIAAPMPVVAASGRWRGRRGPRCRSAPRRAA